MPEKQETEEGNPTELTPTTFNSDALPPKVRERREKDWPEIIDSGIREGIDVLREGQRQRHELAKGSLAIDRSILLVFAIALLGSLFFTFYMIANDKLQPVTQFLFPIITALLGFMSGYFAGSGRRDVRGK